MAPNIAVPRSVVAEKPGHQSNTRDNRSQADSKSTTGELSSSAQVGYACPLCGNNSHWTWRPNRDSGLPEPWFHCKGASCDERPDFLPALGDALGLGRGAPKEAIAAALQARNGHRAAAREPDPLPSLAAVERAVRRLLHEPAGAAALRYLTRSRGLRRGTLARYRIGYVPSLEIGPRPARGLSAIVFPWFDATGELAGVRFRPWPRTVPGMKYAGLAGHRLALYPDVPAGRTLVVCEGELDALRMRQELRMRKARLPVPAVTSTGGMSWEKEWNAVVVGRRVAVVYDAGSLALAQRRAAEFVAAGAVEAWAVDLLAAGLSAREDVSDYLDRYGATRLRELLNAERRASRKGAA